MILFILTEQAVRFCLPEEERQELRANIPFAKPSKDKLIDDYTTVMTELQLGKSITILPVNNGKTIIIIFLVCY